MKRNIAFLLVLVLLTGALAGCERFVPAGEGGRPSLPPTGEGTGPADGTEPTEEKDPTVDEYGFTLFPEGNYLADPMFDTEEYLPDYDADPSYIHTQSTIYPVCSTETTIYSYPKVSLDNGNAVLFTDKETGISMPLCGKPECLHNDESCNAYALDAMGLTVYDGRLYWYDRNDYAIYRIKLDGTGRETVCRTARDCLDPSGTNPCAMFHRGYFYFGISEHVVIGGQPMEQYRVSVQPLDGGEPFVLLDRSMEGSGTCLMEPVGNDMYLFINGYTLDDSGELDTNIFEVYCWSSETRKARQVLAIHEDADGVSYFDRSHGVVPGDGIYYATCDDKGRQTVYRYSFETGETATVLQFDMESGFSYNPYFTREHIAVPMAVPRDDGGSGHRVRLYDYSGELKADLDMGDYYFALFLGEDGDHIYGECLSEPECYFAVPIESGEIITI